MTKEQKFQIRLSVALLTVAVCTSLYAIGGVDGMGGKWLRRFAMPIVFFLSAFWLTRDWKVMLQAPFAMLGLSLGYGADNVWMKVLKRLYCGLICSAAFSMNVIYVAVATLLSVVLGVLNPFPARVEEMILGAVYSSAIFLYVKETV